MPRGRVCNTYGRHKNRVVSVDIWQDGKDKREVFSFSSDSHNDTTGSAVSSTIQSTIENGRKTRKRPVRARNAKIKANISILQNKENVFDNSSLLNDKNSCESSASSTGSSGIFHSAEHKTQKTLCQKKGNQSNASRLTGRKPGGKRKQIADITSQKSHRVTRSSLLKPQTSRNKQNIRRKQQLESSYHVDSIENSRFSERNFSEFDSYDLVMSGSPMIESSPPKCEGLATPDILLDTQDGERSSQGTFHSTPQATKLTKPKCCLYNRMVEKNRKSGQLSNLSNIQFADSPKLGSQLSTRQSSRRTSGVQDCVNQLDRLSISNIGQSPIPIQSPSIIECPEETDMTNDSVSVSVEPGNVSGPTRRNKQMDFSHVTSRRTKKVSRIVSPASTVGSSVYDASKSLFSSTHHSNYMYGDEDGKCEPPELDSDNENGEDDDCTRYELVEISDQEEDSEEEDISEEEESDYEEESVTEESSYEEEEHPGMPQIIEVEDESSYHSDDTDSSLHESHQSEDDSYKEAYKEADSSECSDVQNVSCQDISVHSDSHSDTESSPTDNVSQKHECEQSGKLLSNTSSGSIDPSDTSDGESHDLERSPSNHVHLDTSHHTRPSRQASISDSISAHQTCLTCSAIQQNTPKAKSFKTTAQLGNDISTKTPARMVHLLNSTHKTPLDRLKGDVNFDQSIRVLLTPIKLQPSGELVPPRDKVLHLCDQTETITFDECIPPVMMRQCKKIGEGVYGEVFRSQRHRHSVALKIIPIEGKLLVNDEPQKTFAEILPEIVISKELSELKNMDVFCTPNFVHVKGVSVVEGRFPDTLLHQWDVYHNTKVSENDRPDMYNDDQLFVIFEFEDCGCDMESIKLSGLEQARSILHQVTISMAIAEQSLEFEHRDLHWGNVLVRSTPHTRLTYSLMGDQFQLESCGLCVAVIDFTMSRLSKDNCNIYTNLSEDPTLFEGQGDYQFDIYRAMKHANGNEWEGFEPYTNVLWIHYVADKLFHAKKYPKTSGKAHQALGREFRTFLREATNYNSALHLLTDCAMFKGCMLPKR